MLRRFQLLGACTPACARRHVRVRTSQGGQGGPLRVGTSHSSLKLLPSQQLLEDFSDDLTPFQTFEDLWKPTAADDAPRTFAKCWSLLFAELEAAAKDSDAAAVRRLERNDMYALAKAGCRAELQALLLCLPDELRTALVAHPQFDVDTVEEIFVHVGQPVEFRGPKALTVNLGVSPTVDDVRHVLSRVGRFADDGRACVQGTLHRVSCWMGRTGTVLGVTMRVGRYVPGVATPFLERARKGNLIFLSKPGQGKTTILRDIAVGLSRRPDRPRVVIIDSSNEIGGDSDAPLPYLGRARRLQVPRRSMQQHYMTQAVQNHTPDYVIIDEIATLAEAESALSMSQRGIRLIATAHGETLNKLVQNKELNALVGGVAQAFLSNEERKLRFKTKKTCLERPYDSPFDTVVELRSREHCMMHTQVNASVDVLLDGRDPWHFPKNCSVVRYDAPPGAQVRLPEALTTSYADVLGDDDATTSDAARLPADHETTFAARDDGNDAERDQSRFKERSPAQNSDVNEANSIEAELMQDDRNAAAWAKDLLHI
jgi:stage III sporulation protein SpoIIIAA